MNFSNLNSFGTGQGRGAGVTEFYSNKMNAMSKKKYSKAEITEVDMEKAVAETKGLDMKVAIKAYIDEKYSGISDEDLEKIKEEIKIYLEHNPLKTDADFKKFNDFVKNLFKDFGFKGDLDDMLFGLILGSRDSEEAENSQKDPNLDIEDTFKKFTAINSSLQNKCLTETASNNIDDQLLKAKLEAEILNNLEKRNEELLYAYL